MASDDERNLRYTPALATLVTQPPVGSDWFHEIKHDGYRMALFLERGRVRWMSRHGKNWTAALPELVEAAQGIDAAANTVIDGELAVLLPSGVTSFESLQTALQSSSGSRPLAYFAFDLLFLRGRDLRKTPLEERKARLAEVLATLGPEHAIKYTHHIEGDGARVFENASKLGVEGIVSKRRRSVYREGRTRDWLKTKCWRTGEFVVCGYRRGPEQTTALAELLVGFYDSAGMFRFAGCVGTGKGFSHAFRSQLRTELDAFSQPTSPCSNVQRIDAFTRWVKPVVVVEIAYLELTSDMRLRHPSFRSLRLTRRPEDVVVTVRTRI